jgi:hypothetical protein
MSERRRDANEHLVCFAQTSAAALWAGHVISGQMSLPNGCLRISLLDQRSNQADEFLLFRSVASRDEKGSDLNIGDLAT